VAEGGQGEGDGMPDGEGRDHVHHEPTTALSSFVAATRGHTRPGGRCVSCRTRPSTGLQEALDRRKIEPATDEFAHAILKR
jgi:hypothetical protein